MQHHIKTSFTITFNGDSLSDLNCSVVTMVNNMNVALRAGKQVLKMRERKNGQKEQRDIFSTASQRSVITQKICEQCHSAGEGGNAIWLRVLFRHTVWNACLSFQIKLLRISHYWKVLLEKYSSDLHLKISVPYACTENTIIRISVTLMSLVNSSSYASI